VARTIDMDRKHTTAMLQAAYEHEGSAFIEIYQNCNVFNDKAFLELTGKVEREENRINLEHGEKVVFGPGGVHGVVIEHGSARVVDVADVGLDAIHTHDATNPNAGAAFALSRLSHGPHGPTPVGIFRKVSRPTYEDMLEQQVVDALARKGPGSLDKLVGSIGTWTVE
jgi:2-oxoglutarate ferredoxin oxidoreductase subunit beta